MLIEQRTDIHLSVAKLLQNVKFSYLPHEMEMWMLHKHLKVTEKSIINYIEEDDDKIFEVKNFNVLNKNNTKIILVRNICDKLKSIHLRLEEQILSTNPMIKVGLVSKRSDKNITWDKYFKFNLKSFYSHYNKEIYILA